MRGTIASATALALALTLALQAGTPTVFAQGAGMRQPPAAVTTPPFDLGDPTAVAEGGKLFQQSCTGYCHGREGRVARAPKLRGRSDLEPPYLYSRIANGFPPMPAFQTIFPPEQIWKLVAYIMSLRTATEN
jgi:mono/diheme cytochrome c family protein